MGLLFAENDHDITATVVFIALAVIVAMLLGITVTPSMLLTYSVGYVAIGFLWSFWRYRRHVASKLMSLKLDDTVSHNVRQSRLRELSPTKMVDDIVRWVFTWPFSFANTILGDVVSGVKTLVATTFNRVYTWIYERTLNQFGVGLADDQ